MNLTVPFYCGKDTSVRRPPHIKLALNVTEAINTCQSSKTSNGC